MSRRVKIVIAVAVLLVVGGAAAALALGGGGPAPEVDTIEVTTGDLLMTVTASGRVESGIRADVLPPTVGTLAEVLVEDGDPVTEGTILARLDTEPLELAVAQARAGVAQAESQVATIKDQAPVAADESAASAGVDAAWAQYEAARLALESVGTQAPSQTDLDAAAAGTSAAYKAYLSAKAAYDALKASLEASLVPDPAVAAELTAAEIAKAQAYAGYLSAKAAEQKLRAYDPDLTEEQASAAVDQAYAGYLSAKAQSDKLDRTSISPQLAAAQAGLEQARLALTLAEQNLQDAELTAPTTGVVLFNALGTPSSDGQTPKAQPGSAVGPQAAPFTIVDLAALRFLAEVDEVDIDRIEVGMNASISLDALDEPFEAKVESIRPAATLTATGGTVFPVYLSLAGADAGILIGMKGDATLEVDNVPGALTIPVEALFDEGGAQYVYRVSGETLEKVEITIGMLTETDAEVLDGIEAGDTVALSGPTELKDGMRVRAAQ